MALLCLGEVGRRADLSQAAGVEAAVIAALSADSEDVKAAASLALGGVTYGCLGTALPSLLASISGATGNAKQQYLLLQALGEVVATLVPRGAARSAGAGLSDGACHLCTCKGCQQGRNG